MTNPKASFQFISIHSIKIGYLKLGWHRNRPGSRIQSELDTFDPSLYIFLPYSFLLPSSSLPTSLSSLHLSKWNCTPCPTSRWWTCHRKFNFKFKCTLRISILLKNVILKDEQKQQGHFWDRKKRHFTNQINKCSCSRLIINLCIWHIISASFQQETHKPEVILLCTAHTMDDFFTQRHFSGDQWD